MSGWRYFVSWDTNPEAHDAANHALFTTASDADDFFRLKASQMNGSVHVWRGEIGRESPAHRLDWFHTDWSASAQPKHPKPKGGYGYSGSAKDDPSRRPWSEKPFVPEAYDLKLG